MCNWQLSALKINKPLSQKHGWQSSFPCISGNSASFCNKHSLKLDTWKHRNSAEYWCFWGHLHMKGVCKVISRSVAWHVLLELTPDARLNLLQPQLFQNNLRLSRIYFETVTLHAGLPFAIHQHTHVCAEYLQVAGACGFFFSANLTSTGELMYPWNNRRKKEKLKFNWEKPSFLSHLSENLVSFLWISVAFFNWVKVSVIFHEQLLRTFKW